MKTPTLQKQFWACLVLCKTLVCKQLYNHTCSKTFACKNTCSKKLASQYSYHNTCSKTLVRKTLVANHLKQNKKRPFRGRFLFLWGRQNVHKTVVFFKIDCFHVPKKHKRMQKLCTYHNFCLSSRRKRLPLGKSAVATKKAKLP